MTAPPSFSVGKEDPYRELVKLDQVVKIILGAANSKGLLRIDLPLLGSRDFSGTAYNKIIEAILQDKPYWVRVFQQCKAVIEA